MISCCAIAAYAQFQSGRRKGEDVDNQLGIFDLAIAQKQAELEATAGPSKDSADLAHLLTLAEQKRAVLIECHEDQVISYFLVFVPTM
eukprot:SAG31_NODE_5698_length_2373_cov_20.644239_2_plen_88_part_00